MFFPLSVEPLLNVLKLIGEKHCVYFGGSWPRRCDCKYLNEENLKESFNSLGEQSGCCELRAIYHIVSSLTEEEYKELISRR